MHVVQIHEWGDASKLGYETLAQPEIAANQALVKVQAAGVNPLDWKIGNGMFSENYQLPLVLGAEFSGEVIAVGDSFDTAFLGQQVFGFTKSMTGSYAEYVAVYPDELTIKPGQLDHFITATTPLTALTAWGCLEAGGMVKGSRVLIHGAAGSVGFFAIQLAKHVGAYVVGACRKAQEKRVFPSVDDIRFYEEFPGTSLKDFDIVLDLVGGDIQRQSFDLLKRGGTLISTVMPPEQETAQDRGVLAQMFMVRPEQEKLKGLAAMLSNGTLQPLTAHSYPLSEARQVHQQKALGNLAGKVVLAVNNHQ